jgi:hypothetical protein
LILNTCEEDQADEDAMEDFREWWFADTPETQIGNHENLIPAFVHSLYKKELHYSWYNEMSLKNKLVVLAAISSPLQRRMFLVKLAVGKTTYWEVSYMCSCLGVTNDMNMYNYVDLDNQQQAGEYDWKWTACDWSTYSSPIDIGDISSSDDETNVV